MENPLANRKPDEVRAAIEQAKSIAAEKNAPLTAERLAAALEKYGVPHEYIVFSHSGHGLQNDNKLYALYMEKVVEYLDKYMGE